MDCGSSQGLRAISAAITSPLRWSGLTPARAPLIFPIGVRQASTANTAVIGYLTPGQKISSLSQPNGRYATAVPEQTPRFDTIRTDRLIMRRWTESDREPYAALNADPEVMRYFPAPLSRAQSDAHIDRMEARFAENGVGLWALEVAESGALIGFTGLAPMPAGLPGAGGTEVGWRLAQAAWHQGYASEAARAALNVAFTGVGLDEIWSITA